MKKKNYKSIKKKQELKKDKTFQVLKWIWFFGLGVIFVELIIFLAMYIKHHNKNIDITLYQNIEEVSEGYVTVGSSNFSDSKFHKKSDKEAGLIAVYNKDNELVNEIKFDNYYKTVFNDVFEVSDGYIVVGTAIKNKKDKPKGIIVKFDKDYNIKWEHLFKELDNTIFRSLIIDGNYIYVIGSSIYDNDVIGNEDKGGAIILKYDLDGNLIKTNHFGGNKNGAFYDIIKANNTIYAVGSDTTDTAMLVALNDDLGEIMVKEYSPANHIGFSSIVFVNDNLYITCSKTIEKNKKIMQKATVLQYNLDGELLKEKTYPEEDYSIWNKIIDYNGSLYVVGDGAIKEGKKGSMFVDYIYKGIMAKYTYDLNEEWSRQYDYNNNDYYKDVIPYNNELYVTGYTNSKIKELGSSKNNYVSFIHHYTTDGQK